VPDRRTLLLATRSAGKLRELGPMIREAGFVPLTLDDLGIPIAPEEESVEAFDTFEANAMAKARYFIARARGAGGQVVSPPTAVLADDSGLEVTALAGAPGVRSKRFSGSALEGQALDDANNAKLMGALRGATDRRARYVCVAAIVSERGEWHARGSCDGVMLESPRGEDGFGYDPYFFSDELKKTFGEATRVEKEAVSHRARAVAAVIELFQCSMKTQAS
jgi:XTP/dITP diphosphohydrolase